MVDWTKPLEAVHENGMVLAVVAVEDDGSDIMPKKVDLGDWRLWANVDGTVPVTDWTIRNVMAPHLNALGDDK